MPTAALRPCLEPRCPTLVQKGRCAAHARDKAQVADARRPTAQDRGYTYRWSRLSKAYLQRYPLCGMRPEEAYEGWRGECYEQGRVTPATCTDHIVPHKGDKRLFWDGANWQAICAHCHDSIKAQLERSGTMKGCDAQGVPLDPGHFWNTPS